MDGLRIVSDGTAEGTHVYLDGNEVHDVTSVTWNFSPRKRKTYVTLEISNVKIEATQPVDIPSRASLEAVRS